MHMHWTGHRGSRGGRRLLGGRRSTSPRSPKAQHRLYLGHLLLDLVGLNFYPAFRTPEYEFRTPEFEKSITLKYRMFIILNLIKN